MPFNGSGTYNPAAPAYPAVSGTVIYADDWNSIVEDIADALSNCVTRDGQSPPTQNIPMGGKKLTNLAAGSATTDAVNFGQVFDGGTFANATFTGLTNLLGATVRVATMPAGTSTNDAASTAFVASAGLSTALPGQSGNAGAEITTDGSAASWGFPSKYVGRTSNIVLSKANNRNFINITGGAPFTQTFGKAADLGNGWSVRIRNSSGGDITVDFDGTETCDGLTSFVMYPYEVRDFYSDGVSAFYSIPLISFFKRFTASTTFTKPPGYAGFEGFIWGGGAGGQNSGSAATLSVGGGGGGCVQYFLPESSVAATESLTIGGGGAAAAPGTGGGSGGSTSIGALLSISGGVGNQGGTISFTYPEAAAGMDAIGYQGGRSNGGRDMVRAEWGGGGGVTFQTAVVSGSSIWGGGAGGSLSSAGVVAAPGTSKFGGAGGAASIASSGTAGTAPGGGGGATQTGALSGAGARGQIDMRGVL